MVEFKKVYRRTQMNKNLLYCIPAGQYGKEGVLSLLAQHPEIRFVSLVGIDLAGNDTDERIPIEIFMKDYEDFFAGKAVQTDGSSVVFMNIATLNDARVDMVADSTVNWYVDYNDDNVDEETGLPIGTLRIPSFLIHNGKFIDSRSILKQSCEYVADRLRKLLVGAQVKGMENFPFSEIQDIVFTTGTELEFWVKTPSEKETVQHLSISQRLQEQYWQRMRGNVRTAMEQAIEELDARGMHAFAINHQRDENNDQRCLRTWPTGITTCPSLIQFQIGSNDIRKVEETLTSHLYILNIADNPNISIDVTSVCPYIKAGMYKLFYDKNQDIRGCDALDLEN